MENLNTLNEKKRRHGLIGYENRVLLVLFFTFGFVFFDRLAISFLFPFMSEEYGLTNTDLGTLSAVLALTWSISGPTIGIFAGKAKRKIPLLAVLIIIFSTVSFGAGLITTFATLLILRALMGVIEGPVLPICQSIMSVESSEKRRGLNMGLVQSASAALLASTLGPVILVAIATSIGWRYGFYVTIVPGIIIAICAIAFLDEPRKVNISLMSLEEQEKVSFLDCIKFRNIWLGIIIAILLLIWYLLLVTFGANYLISSIKMDPNNAAFAMAGLGLGGFIWGFGVPAISDRLGRKPTVIVTCFIGTLSPLCFIFLHGNYILMAVVLVIVHVIQGTHVIVFSIIPSESVPQKYIPASVGLIMGTGEIVGGVLAPILAGYLADTVDPSAPFWMSAAGSLIAGFLSFGYIETAPIKVKRNTKIEM